MSGFWDLWSGRVQMGRLLPHALHFVQFSFFHVCCGKFDNEESDDSYILRCTSNATGLLDYRNACGTATFVVSAKPWLPYRYKFGIDAGGSTG